MRRNKKGRKKIKGARRKKGEWYWQRDDEAYLSLSIRPSIHPYMHAYHTLGSVSSLSSSLGMYVCTVHVLYIYTYDIHRSCIILSSIAAYSVLSHHLYIMGEVKSSVLST